MMDMKGTKSFTEAAVVGTARKIRRLLHAAAMNEVDHLVLSAFGCGVFKNPPEQVAEIFSLVLQDYGGYFKSVTFAVLGSSYDVFASVFSSMKTIVSSTLDAQVYKPHCDRGALCLGLVDDKGAHFDNMYHGHRCGKFEECPRTSNFIHSCLVMHRIPCAAQGKCKIVGEDWHAQRFSHPPQCPAGEHCCTTSEAHLRENLHLPVCYHGWKCPQRRNGDYHSMRHLIRDCTNKYCTRFLNEEHMSEYNHPFIRPCTKLFRCVDTSSAHQRECSHFCREGSSCTRLDEAEHCKYYIHLPPHLCPHPKCDLMHSEEHLMSFQHKGVCDHRPACPDGWKCKHKYSAEHTMKYSHPIADSLPTIPIDPHSVMVAY
eukprot:PhF_6_TR18522/c0_g1_i1/m.27057